MRIAVWHNLPPGGGKRALDLHVRGLVARGHHVEAWCPTTADRDFLPLSEIIDEHVVPFGYEAPPPWWAPGRRGQMRDPKPFIKASTEHARSCANEMADAQFDVHLAATCQFFGSPPIGRFWTGPSVLYLQEPHRWLYEAAPVFPWLGTPTPESIGERLTFPARATLEAVRAHRRSQRARYEIENAQSFDRVLVNSLFSRESVLRVYGVDADVCYLGVDTKRFARSTQRRDNMVLGVGRLSYHKNAALLVQAVGLIDGPKPRVEWVAATVDAQYHAHVEELARRTGVEFRVHIAAGDETLIDALSRASAVVYTPQLEPFGLVPLEANACGTPVVGSAEGGMRETVSDGVNGILTLPRPDALRAVLEQLLQDTQVIERMGAEGRRIAEEKWTNEAAVDRLEAALREVLRAANR